MKWQHAGHQHQILLEPTWFNARIPFKTNHTARWSLICRCCTSSPVTTSNTGKGRGWSDASWSAAINHDSIYNIKPTTQKLCNDFHVDLTTISGFEPDIFRKMNDACRMKSKPTFAPRRVDYSRIEMEFHCHSRGHLIISQVVTSSGCKTIRMSRYIENILLRGVRDRYRARTIGKTASGRYW
jgi:hypothetical protein